MATLPNLSEFEHFLDETTDATLTLPIRDREYTWQSGDLSIAAMLLMQRVESATREIGAALAAGKPVDPNRVVLTNAEDLRLTRELVGPDTLTQLAADGVKWRELQHIVATLMTWHLNGEQAARKVWARGQEDQPADPPAPAASTKTAGSSTRKTPASRSAGGKSSRTGRSSKPTSTASTKSTSATGRSSTAGRRAGS